MSNLAIFTLFQKRGKVLCRLCIGQKTRSSSSSIFRSFHPPAAHPPTDHIFFIAVVWFHFSAGKKPSQRERKKEREKKHWTNPLNATAIGIFVRNLSIRIPRILSQTSASCRYTTDGRIVCNGHPRYLYCLSHYSFLLYLLMKGKGGGLCTLSWLDLRNPSIWNLPSFLNSNWITMGNESKERQR